ncbi:hypothetical protein BN946_scf185016.g49 [Trametes cinnabarina]|uniref:DNA 3'-5' helicase n=1 Tax=Pycnoporus cinnabarinus TaxID=5643 RepID=A0A060SHB5_PYCCI|nr:hypothetical protein BN946_scf185016.g49 [Trametes cinnabarina]
MPSHTAERVAPPPPADTSCDKATDSDDPDLHTDRVARSAKLIKTARENAAREHGYQSRETRSRLSVAFAEASSGKQPYDWQLDVSEALLLGLDTVVTAGTGAGKSIPFVMPLLLEKSSKKMVIIISPLNELERDQARRYKGMGLSAAAVNGEDYTAELHREIAAKSVQVLITSPEMCLEHPSFSALVHAPDFMQDVLYVVVDEAHCISQWGDQFRKKYAELSKLRSFLGVRKAFGLFTATFPNFMATDVFLKLEFRELTTYFCNLGNDRPNITAIVHTLKAAQSSLPIIDCLVRDARPGTTLPRAILFFNTRDLAFKAYRYLQDCVCPMLRPQINFLHAGRGQRARRRAVREFRSGVVNVLCATEAAGMPADAQGMDISDIKIIIQFLVPSSLSVWVQRAGRAGRGGDHCYAVLLIEPTVFEAKPAPKPHTAPSSAPNNVPHPPTTFADPISPGEDRAEQSDRTEDESTLLAAQNHGLCTFANITLFDLSCNPSDGVVEYKKNVEDGMRLWACATSCRRAVANAYFDNPPTSALSSALFPCCDNCVRAKNAKGNPLSCEERAVLDFIDCLANGSDIGQRAMDDEDDLAEGVTMAGTETNPGLEDVKVEATEEGLRHATILQNIVFPMRRGVHLADCRARLYRWRMETWSSKYVHCVFTHLVLLPDPILTRLASQGRIQMVSDLKRYVPQWAFADVHGADVLHVLSVIDTRHRLEIEAKKQIKHESQGNGASNNAKRKNKHNTENTAGMQIRHVKRCAQNGATRLTEAGSAAPETPGDSREPLQYIFKAHVFPQATSANLAPSENSSASQASYPGPVRFIECSQFSTSPNPHPPPDALASGVSTSSSRPFH